MVCEILTELGRVDQMMYPEGTMNIRLLLNDCGQITVHGVFGDGGSNGAISGWIKSKMAASGHFGKKLQMAISQQRVIRSTSCLVLGWFF